MPYEFAAAASAITSRRAGPGGRAVLIAGQTLITESPRGYDPGLLGLGPPLAFAARDYAVSKSAMRADCTTASPRRAKPAASFGGEANLVPEA